MSSSRRTSPVCLVFPSSVVSSIFLEGGSCDLKGKQDKQDFHLLLRCFEAMGLQADQVASVWAILSSILQLGNICFTSSEVGVSLEERRDFLIVRFCLCFRASRLRWLVSSVRRRSGGLEACCRFLLRLCRRSSLIELRSGIPLCPRAPEFGLMSK